MQVPDRSVLHYHWM